MTDTPESPPSPTESDPKAKSNRTATIVIIAVVGVAVLCALAIIVVAAGLIIYGTLEGAPPEGFPTQLPPEAMPPLHDIDARMDLTRDVIVAIRGLPLYEDVPRDIMSEAELRVEFEADFEEDYSEEDAFDDSVILAAFDVFPPGFDVYGFYIDLYSQGVAGYYDSEVEEFFLIAEDESYSADNELTVAHEYVHVLQDQNLNLDTLLPFDDDAYWEEHPDEAFARQALVEGDATLSEELYLTHYFTIERQDELFDYYENADFSFYDAMPAYIVDHFSFPYVEGAEFVRAIYDRGGFDAVNAAYDDPPTSTEQILHPEKYFDREDPLEVDLPDMLPILGDSYREIISQPLGEFTLIKVLEIHSDSNTAARAADGWGGDRYAVYYDEGSEDTVMLLRIAWDSEAETDEFINQTADYGENWSAGDDGAEDDLMTCWTRPDATLCIARMSPTETLLVRAGQEGLAREIATFILSAEAVPN